jgi:predicted TIM-barrel fold metal-dependent hydrolase
MASRGSRAAVVARAGSGSKRARWIAPWADRDREEELGLRGLKIHGHGALPTAEVMAAAARHRIPVLVDVVRKVDAAGALANRNPDVSIIVAHLGAFADDWHGQRRLTDLLREYPNLYADSSGVRYWDVLERAARLAPAKLVFGSDGPFLHPGVELAKIRLLPVPEEVRGLIAGGTMAMLVGIAETAA